MFIKVWCEYDFSGKFGGNNNEDVFVIEEDKSQDEIERMVLNMLSNSTGAPEEDLEDLYGWEVINIKYL